MRGVGQSYGSLSGRELESPPRYCCFILERFELLFPGCEVYSLLEHVLIWQVRRRHGISQYVAIANVNAVSTHRTNLGEMTYASGIDGVGTFC